MNEQKIIELLRIKETDKVLDVGGSMKQLQVIKVDTLVDLIHPTKSRYNTGRLLAKVFRQVDIEKEKLPFKDRAFDVAICSHVIEDLHNPFLVLDEMSRVAKRGIIIVPSRGKDSEFGSIDRTNWGTGARRVPGMAHHNWFFETSKEVLIAIPKNYPLLYSSGMQIVKWSGEEECVYVWDGKINYIFDQKLNLEFRELINNYKDFLKKRKKDIKLGIATINIDNPWRYTWSLVKGLRSGMMARILSVGYVGFVSLFALDVFGQPKWALALIMHLIPSLILTGVTIAAWKNERLGGVMFLILGLGMWVLLGPASGMIFAPAIILGILFLMVRK